MTLDSTKAQKVQVTLLGRDFYVACTPAEKSALQKAAKALDEKLRALRSQGSGAACNFDQLLVVVALNLCDELASQTPQGLTQDQISDAKSLNSMIKKIDHAMSNHCD